MATRQRWEPRGAAFLQCKRFRITRNLRADRRKWHQSGCRPHAIPVQTGPSQRLRERGRLWRSLYKFRYERYKALMRMIGIDERFGLLITDYHGSRSGHPTFRGNPDTRGNCQL